MQIQKEKYENILHTLIKCINKYFPGNNLEQYQSNVPRETYKKKI